MSKLDNKDGTQLDLVAVAVNAVFQVYLESEVEGKEFLYKVIENEVRKLAGETEDMLSFKHILLDEED